jgi:hypothetical protein
MCVALTMAVGAAAEKNQGTGYVTEGITFIAPQVSM